MYQFRNGRQLWSLMFLVLLLVVASFQPLGAQHQRPARSKLPGALFPQVNRAKSQSVPNVHNMRVIADRPAHPPVSEPDQALLPAEDQAAAVELIQAAKRAEHDGQSESCAELYAEALAKYPNDRQVLLNYARWQHRSGALEPAVATYEQYLKEHPDDAVALNDLGLCHARDGDLNRAIQYVTAAANRDPSSQRYRNNLATLLVESNQVDRALKVLTDVHGEAVGNYNLAFLLDRRARGHESVPYLQKALSLNPGLDAARQLLAQVAAMAPPQAPTIDAPILERNPAEPVEASAPRPTFVAAQSGQQPLEPEDHVLPAVNFQPPRDLAPDVEAYPIPGLRD